MASIIAVMCALLLNICCGISTKAATPRTTQNIKNGVDVSKWQSVNGKIDWQSVKASGFQFAIIKAGGRYQQSGGLYQDPYFAQNIVEATSAGLQVGIYFYSQAITTDEAYEEANYVYDIIKKYDFDMPVYMDYEWDKGTRADNGASNIERTNIVRTFCNRIAQLGYNPGVYTSDYNAYKHINMTDFQDCYSIWIAHYKKNENDTISYYNGKYDVWQYTSSGVVNGINTNVDLDYFYDAGQLTSNGTVFRLYNPNSGEHFYTINSAERSMLVNLGWVNEKNAAWNEPLTENVPVYRAYNPVAGEHHYTCNWAEIANLVSAGWIYEGISFYSSGSEGIPVYREYNPNQFSCNHNYTTSKYEHDYLISLGWIDEGISWYALP